MYLMLQVGVFVGILLVAYSQKWQIERVMPSMIIYKGTVLILGACLTSQLFGLLICNLLILTIL